MRLRLSKTALLALAVGIFVIGFVCLYVVYSGQSGEQKRLNDSLATAQTRVPKVTAQRQDLESQLAQGQDELDDAETALSTAMAKFPKSVESVDYDELLVGIASDCGLEVSKITASEPQDIKVKGEAGDITYAVTTLEVTVRAIYLPPAAGATRETYIDATVASILTFIKDIDTNGHFNNATIESVEMKNLEPTAEDSPPKPSATIKLVIYAYKGE